MTDIQVRQAERQKGETERQTDRSDSSKVDVEFIDPLLSSSGERDVSDQKHHPGVSGLW